MTVEYVRLGTTGMKVSRICLGCMTFGDATRGTHAWTIDEEASRPVIQQALELGINFLDTAASRAFARRDEVILATKVFNRMRPGPNGMGLSRKAIFSEIDNSLRRLGTDYVDLYVIHRWDYATPIEETLAALHEVVKAGKARYIGASSMHAWQFSKALYTSQLNGWTRFVSMQNHLNLLYREEEREMMPLCADQGIAVTPWSPLARGRLSRAWGESSQRLETDESGKRFYSNALIQDEKIVDAVGAIAKARGVSRAQVALAWLVQKKGVTAPIIGASKPQHLADAVAAASLGLTAEDMKALEAPYVPHAVSGFQIA